MFIYGKIASLFKGSVDSTWVFLGWEGIAAELDGLELTNFPLSDAGVPYGYSPVLLAHPDLLSTPEKRDQLKTFLAITERGKPIVNFRILLVQPTPPHHLLVL